MGHIHSFGDSRSYFRTPLGGGEGLAQESVSPPNAPRPESPETIANRERVTRNLKGKA